MSTKATMELIEWAKKVADATGDDAYWNLALEAKKEVEAIGRAAKAMHRCDIIYPTSTDVSEIEAAVAVFASISKDAP